MGRLIVGLVVLCLGAALLYVRGPSIPPEVETGLASVPSRLAARELVSPEANAYIVLQFLADRHCVQELNNRWNERPFSGSLERSLDEFGSLRPRLRAALERRTYVQRRNASWLPDTVGYACLVWGREQKDPALRLEATLEAWTLVQLIFQDDEAPLVFGSSLAYHVQQSLFDQLPDLSHPQRLALAEFLQASPARQEVLLRWADTAYHYGQQGIAQSTPPSPVPSWFYRARERRLALSYYGRQRKCIQDQVDPVTRGLDFDADRQTMIACGDRAAADCLVDLRRQILYFRHILDRQDLLLAALTDEPPKSPRVRREGGKVVLDDPDLKLREECPTGVSPRSGATE